MHFPYKIILLFLFSIIAVNCYGISFVLSGDISIPIKRSSAGNWSSDNSTTMTAENTSGVNYKIVIECSSFFPLEWHDRYLKISPVNFADWQAVNPPTTYQSITLINNGVLSGPQDFIWFIAPGNYPALTLNYDARADLGADLGPAQANITYTFIEQF